MLSDCDVDKRLIYSCINNAAAKRVTNSEWAENFDQSSHRISPVNWNECICPSFSHSYRLLLIIIIITILLNYRFDFRQIERCTQASGLDFGASTICLRCTVYLLYFPFDSIEPAVWWHCQLSSDSSDETPFSKFDKANIIIHRSPLYYAWICIESEREFCWCINNLKCDAERPSLLT